MNKFLFVFVCLLIVGCREGHFVDKNSDGFVDVAARRAVIDQSDSRFQYPPGAFNENATISISEKQQLIGNNAAKIWIWSGNKKELVLLSVGEKVNLGTIGGTLKLVSIENGAAAIELNGFPLPLLAQKQETNSDGTWVFVTDLFVGGDFNY